jgi:hypothetical protein
MSLKSLASRRAAKRRLGKASKVTFESFASAFLNEQVGERASSLSTSSSLRSKPLPKGTRVVASALALVALVVPVFVLTDPKSDLFVSEATQSPLPLKSELECDFTLTTTATESRSVSNFGGLSVQSGRVECEGQTFIITHTSNGKGEVISVKKKRA